MSLFKKIIAFGFLLISFAVVYYFVIELPRIERQNIIIECQNDVISDSNKYLELNGTPVKGEEGVFNISQTTTDELARMKKDGNENCIKLYGQ